MIPRQKNTRHRIGPLLRLSQAFADRTNIYSNAAAAYGLLYAGPWGRPGADIVAFGDEVLEHMVSEGGAMADILDTGLASWRELATQIPKQDEVDEEVGNSGTAGA